MSFKKDIPAMNATYDDLLYHPGWAYPTQGEREIECVVIGPDEVEVANWTLDVTEALRTIEFYNNSTFEDGPCGFSRDVIFETGGSDSARVPGHIVEDIVMWLKHALGVESYDGPSDRWEAN